MLTYNTSSVPAQPQELTSRLASPGVKATTPNFTASTSPRPRRCCGWTRSYRSRLGAAKGWLKLPNGRALTGQNHDYKRHGTIKLFAALGVAIERNHRNALKTASPRRVSQFHERHHRGVSDWKLRIILDNLNTHK